MLIRNPKNPTQEFETELTLPEAVEILKKVNNPFARDLLVKYPNLTAVQNYWFMKIAEDNRPKPRTLVKLKSNLHEFLKPMGLVQFRLGELDISLDPRFEELKTFGKLKFYASEKQVRVESGLRHCGEIIGDEFFPVDKCPESIRLQVQLFAVDPVMVLEYFGKATGHCCICGRLLTNEGSVERGIGPICAGRYGL